MAERTIHTADLCDALPTAVQVAEPIFHDYGAVREFRGMVSTLKLHEDNSLVREALAEAGEGRVLVVDGGGSTRCALVGDRLAALGSSNGWAGVVVFGCVRDSRDLAGISLGIKALGTHPMRSIKRGQGERDVAVRFAGVTFVPGHHLVADGDGIVVVEHDPALEENHQFRE